MQATQAASRGPVSGLCSTIWTGPYSSPVQVFFPLHTEDLVFSFTETTPGAPLFTRTRGKRGPGSPVQLQAYSQLTKASQGAGAGDGLFVLRMWVARALWTSLREGLAGRFHFLFLDASPVWQPSLDNLASFWRLCSCVGPGPWRLVRQNFNSECSSSFNTTQWTLSLKHTHHPHNALYVASGPLS